MKTIIERFWGKVTDRPADSCWLWKGSKKSNGYGQFSVDGAPRLAHRVSFELANGPISDGLIVRHKCDTPGCVRPDHLEVGTQLDNIRDMESRGRARKIGVLGERNPAAKLSDSSVQAIRSDQASSLSKLSKKYGVSPQRISQIQARKTRSPIKEEGEFVEVG